MRIICCIYKDFVRQLKAFREMSPRWGHLINWMDPSVGHLNGILARVGGNLNNNFQKSQMPGGLPGGCWSFDLTYTLCCRANFIFAAGLTLRCHKADLFRRIDYRFLVIFVSYIIYHYSSLLNHSLPLRFEDHDVYMMKLYWKEFAPLFQSSRVYAEKFYAIFPCSDFVLLNFVSAHSRITSGRNLKISFTSAHLQ